jgi:hypothetical protein
MAQKKIEVDSAVVQVEKQPSQAEKLKGISFPIAFSTNKLSRRTVTRAPMPVSGYMEIYFSPNPIRMEEVDLLEPGRRYAKAEALYRKHHVYGDHRFLIPSTKEQIKKYEAPWDIQFEIGRIGNDPTTATYFEKLQLLPCSAPNLGLFKENLLTEPFYLELASDAFVLHVKNAAGSYIAIPAQAFSPRCWHGFAHPVVTLQMENSCKPFYKFSDILWHDFAKNI